MNSQRQPSSPALTPEEHEALDAFAATHGRSWKLKLRVEWEGSMPSYGRHHPAASSILLRLRGSAAFGPKGLEAYRPGKVPTETAQLERYLAEPTLLRWEAIHFSFIPGTDRTLWHSWVFVDGDAQEKFVACVGFTKFPNASTTRSAIAAARAGHVPQGPAATRAGAAR